MLELRPYQQDIIAKVLADWDAGYTDVLVTAATGSGKTVVFLALLDRVLAPGRRGLVLAHRAELIQQPYERIEQFFSHRLSQTGIVMAERNECDRQLVIATVQTLANPVRLQQVLAYGPIDYLVTDEGHHAPAASYRAVYDALRAANPSRYNGFLGLRHVGVTATPVRADDKTLAEVYQKESAKYGIKELVQLGYLVPPRWLAIQTGISLAGIPTHDGDYTQRRLADVYETANCFDLVVESHRQYAGERQAIAFAVSVDGAYELAEKFNDAGIPAAASDGGMPKPERANILRAFRAGELRVLCNVALWTEGLDVPQIGCVHQVRPTKADGLYVQMIGRALRPVPGKEDALILDYAPLEARNVVMAGDVLGVPARKEVYIQESQERGEVIGGFTFDGSVRWLNGSPMELISRQLDYLSMSPWVWSKANDGYLVLGLGQGADGIDRTLVMSPVSGSMTLWGIARRLPAGQSQSYKLAEGDFEQLSELAEAYANKWGNAALAGKARQWRSQPASEGQIQYARRLRVWQPTMSKGQCAEAITRALALKTLQREGYA